MLKWMTDRITPARLAVTLFVVVLLLWGSWLAWGAKLALKVVGPVVVASLGQVGDLFGGINALFAAFAFAGVAVAAYYQHLSWQLLSDQSKREESRHARESFQPLFFQLLSHLPAFPACMRSYPTLPTGGLLIVGGGAQPVYDTGEILDALRTQILTSVQYAAARLGNRTVLPHIQAFYDDLYKANEASLGPYLRSLYHIFKLIDMSDLGDKERVQYANIARAKLDISAIFVLTLNCSTTRGNEFKPFVERYGLLKHVYRTGDADLPSPDEAFAEWCYSPTAVMSADSREAFWDLNPDQDPR